MRRLAAIFMLLMLAFPLTACTRNTAPNLTGWWETSSEETLCATMLLLNPDNSYWLCSEGMRWKGTWALDGSTLTLQDDLHLLTGTAIDASPLRYTVNEDMSVIDIGSGLHLYRKDNEDVTGYWWAGSSSLHLMDSGIFIFQKHESLELTALDGGEYLTGNWTQEGLIITLHVKDGPVQTATAVINPESVGAGWMTLFFDGVSYHLPVE